MTGSHEVTGSIPVGSTEQNRKTPGSDDAGVFQFFASPRARGATERKKA